MKTKKKIITEIISEIGSFVMLAWTSDQEDIVEVKTDADVAALAEIWDAPVVLVQTILLNLEALRDAAAMDLEDLHRRIERLEQVKNEQ